MLGLSYTNLVYCIKYHVQVQPLWALGPYRIYGSCRFYGPYRLCLELGVVLCWLCLGRILSIVQHVMSNPYGFVDLVDFGDRSGFTDLIGVVGLAGFVRTWAWYIFMN